MTDVFCIDLKKVDEEGKWDEFQEAMNGLADLYVKEMHDIAKKFKVSLECAADIQYLRTRSRWSQENEDELIRMDQAGEERPNIFDWPNKTDRG